MQILDARISVALGGVAEALAEVEIDEHRAPIVAIARGVGAVAADQHVGADRADQDVVPVGPVEPVVAAFADDEVGLRRADHILDAQ